MSLKFHWSDYKETLGSRSVQFPGGFHLYVVCYDNKFERTDKWRVKWYVANKKYKSGSRNNKEDQYLPGVMIGLTDQRFDTRLEAQYAAERIFVPIALIAEELVKVETKVTIKGLLDDKRNL